MWLKKINIFELFLSTQYFKRYDYLWSHFSGHPNNYPHDNKSLSMLKRNILIVPYTIPIIKWIKNWKIMFVLG